MRGDNHPFISDHHTALVFGFVKKTDGFAPSHIEDKVCFHLIVVHIELKNMHYYILDRKFDIISK